MLNVPQKYCVFISVMICIIILTITFAYVWGRNGFNSLGTYLTGIGAVIGSLTYFDTEGKKRTSNRTEEILKSIINLRQFLTGIYKMTLPFGLDSDQMNINGQEYPSYLKSIREERMKEYNEELQIIKEDMKKYDSYMDQRSVELFDEIVGKWKEITLNFRLWVDTFNQSDLRNKNSEYYSKSQLGQEEYKRLYNELTNIITRLNPNYSKSLSDIIDITT